MKIKLLTALESAEAALSKLAELQWLTQGELVQIDATALHVAQEDGQTALAAVRVALAEAGLADDKASVNSFQNTENQLEVTGKSLEYRDCSMTPKLITRPDGTVDRVTTGASAREYRESKRVSQCEVARAMHVDQSLISRLEAGAPRRKWSAELLKRYTAAVEAALASGVIPRDFNLPPSPEKASKNSGSDRAPIEEAHVWLPKSRLDTIHKYQGQQAD